MKNNYFYLITIFLLPAIAGAILPQETLANNSQCSNFWVNPQTGQKECLDPRIPSSQADDSNSNNDAIDPNKSAKDYFVEGKIHYGKREFQKAIEDCNKAIQIKADFPKAYNYLGKAYLGQGNFQKAIQNFDQAIKQNSSYVNAYNNRGFAYFKQGQLTKAIKNYDKAISLNSSFAKAYNNRAVAYRRQGKLKKAIQGFTQAIQHNPNLAYFYRNRALVWKQQGKTANARKDLEKASRMYRQRGQTRQSENIQEIINKLN